MSIAAISGWGSAALDPLRQELFARADADRNGGLSLNEFKTLGKELPAGIAGSTASAAGQGFFGALDSDGDGNLSGAEVKPPEGFRPPVGGGFAPDGLATLLAGQEAAAGGQIGSLITELLARYRKHDAGAPAANGSFA